MDYSVLVNRKHKIPEDFLNEIDMVKVLCVDGEVTFCEKETYEHYVALRQMILDTTGLEIGIDSAFRTAKRQQELYYEFVEKEGKEYADSIVAPVGCSEHETGLAIDLSMHIEDKGFLLENKDLMDYEDVFRKFVHPHLKEYGFILRYPKGKEEITGYSYEPWHIRYVGVEFLKPFYNRVEELTLEEMKGEI